MPVRRAGVVLTLALCVASASAFAPVAPKRAATKVAVTTYPDVPSARVDEGAMPPVGFWDPWGLAELGSDETNAWFRHAELKHGRVAMAAVTGWCVTALGFHFPGAIDYSGTTFESLGTDPIAAWDALSGAGKFQIIGLIGFLEFHSELAKPHVMRGGTPGKITPLLGPISLWDPIGTMGGLSEEAKFVQRTKEIANGRLAMIAIISFFSASFIPGSVPFIPNV